jgi:hypothetical protein
MPFNFNPESRRPPPAAIIPTDESELDNESVPAPRKTYKTRMKDNSSDENTVSAFFIVYGQNLKNPLD